MSREVERDDIGRCQLLPGFHGPGKLHRSLVISGAQVPRCLHMGTHITSYYILLHHIHYDRE